MHVDFAPPGLSERATSIYQEHCHPCRICSIISASYSSGISFRQILSSSPSFNSFHLFLLPSLSYPQQPPTDLSLSLTPFIIRSSPFLPASCILSTRSCHPLRSVTQPINQALPHRSNAVYRHPSPYSHLKTDALILRIDPPKMENLPRQHPVERPSRYELEMYSAGEEERASSSSGGPWLPTHDGKIIRVPKDPPITAAFLRGKYDWDEISADPELRHHHLFDIDCHLPISMSNAPLPTSNGTKAPGRRAAEEHSRMVTLTEMYWQSIAAEFVAGCRCVRWRLPSTEQGEQPNVEDLNKRQRVETCVCDGWKRSLGDADFFRWQASQRWPSRLPALFLCESTSPAPTRI